MKDFKSLKEREQKILKYMIEEIKDKGYPPTVREICAAVGIKSTSTAHKDIDNLMKAGFLRKDPAKPRTLVIATDIINLDIADAGDAAPVPVKSGASASVDLAERNDVVDVPVIGNVAAGTPILSEQNIEDTFPIPAQFVKGKCFMLHVRGDSMINVGIMDGDLILVEEQNTARNGEIVVAMVDGFETEATVKTFYREDNHIRLQPENDTMSPIIVEDVRIAGKVKGVFRYFS
ncbi:MAG: transcriptional repressor LexA [Emergencia sp.]